VSDAQRDERAGVVSATGSIGAATLASRVLGYVRDMVVARAFGAGPVTDAFFVAFRIPNLLRRLLAEGALSTAVIPVFAQSLAAEGRAAFLTMVRAVVGAGTLTLCVVTLAGMVLARAIVTVMAPGWLADPSLFDLAVGLTRLMFPYLLLVGLAALATGVLNAHGRFFTAAFGPAVLNIGMIAAVLLLARRFEPPVVALAVGVLAGGLGQLLVQLPEVRRLGVPLRPSGEWRHPAVATIARRLAPAAFGLAAVQVTVLVNTLLASLLPKGSISFLYYADRVMEFPLGVFGIALATAALPTMAAQAARDDRAGLTDTLGFALRLAVFVAVPAAAGLLALGGPIVTLLFQRGEFGPVEAAATTQALAAYAVGLPAFSATRLAAQTFYAVGDTRTPVLLGLLAVAANIALAVALMGPLAHAGLALASSLSAYVNLFTLLWALRRRLGPIGGRALVRSGARTLLATVALVLAARALAPAADTGLLAAAHTAGAIAAGAAAFVAAAAGLRAPELGALLDVLRRRR
jgi:putative peptidoglycan lipid II flippase